MSQVDSRNSRLAPEVESASTRLEWVTPAGVALHGAPEIIKDQLGTYRLADHLTVWPPGNQEEEVSRSLALTRAERVLGWLMAGLITLAAFGLLTVIVLGLADGGVVRGIGR